VDHAASQLPSALRLPDLGLTIPAVVAHNHAAGDSQATTVGAKGQLCDAELTGVEQLDRRRVRSHVNGGDRVARSHQVPAGRVEREPPHGVDRHPNRLSDGPAGLGLPAPGLPATPVAPLASALRRTVPPWSRAQVHSRSRDSPGLAQRNPVSSSHMLAAASLNEDGVARLKGLVHAPPFNSYRPGFVWLEDHSQTLPHRSYTPYGLIPLW
jgi:hypothetical protein